MKVAVENNLSDVKDYLTENGLEVINYDNGTDLDECDVIVVTGLSDDTMDIEDTATDAVIIEASGLTPEEIYDEIVDMFDEEE